MNVFIGLFALFCAVFLMFRNTWVLVERVEQAYKNQAEYDKLCSYTCMLFKFWVWDIEKFKEKS